MCDDDIHQGLADDPRVSRRTFGLTTMAAAGVAGSAVAQSNVAKKDGEDPRRDLRRGAFPTGQHRAGSSTPALR